MKVADLSEAELLARIVPLLPTGRATLIGPGDDSAVLRLSGDQVITADTLVEGRHFRLDWSSGRDVGWRAGIANLADVVAMGGRPQALVVSLQLPGSTEVTWVQDLANGLAEVCGPHGVGVVGGDLSSAADIAVSVTAVGDLDGGEPVLRSGAQPGDVVAVAGVLGASAAGLALLGAKQRGMVLTGDDEELVTAHLRPDPPLVAGSAAAGAGAHAMLDISDGLVRDAGRIAAASGVRIDLDAALLGPDRDRLALAGEQLGVDPLDWVMAGGEDHSLLATMPAGVVPAQFRVIGRVVAGSGVALDGTDWVGPTGWDHFGH